MSTLILVSASVPPPNRATTNIIMVIGWRIAKTIGFI